MAQKKKRPTRRREVHLLVGTRKGGFLFRSDRRRRTWRIEGPIFAGWEVNHLTRDPRTGRLWAAINTTWWGNDLQVSDNYGKKWRKASNGLGFAPDRGLKLNRVWQLVPDRASRPETLWCGVDPGALFRTDDSGRNWYEVNGLNRHPTREKWAPGGGGMMVHAVIPDPARPKRIYVGISVAGCFRSDDDGESWRPLNKGVLADFLPDHFPEVGQCVHRMVMSPADPDRLFQQNHCGVYRSRDAAETWEDVSRGLPSRFGFPMAAHPREPETLYVVPEYSPERRYVCEGRLGVFRSRNGGRTWQRLTRGLPQKNVYTAVLRHAATTDACDEAGVYVGTTGGEIFYSRNQGDSWELLHAHLPPVLSLEAALL
ncbi:MAG: exo-alpha-sialidase [Terriglobia bacterium]